MNFQWKSIFPAINTPFTVIDELDIELFGKSLSAQLEAGVHGIIIGGSLAEASTLTNTEKKTLVKFAFRHLNNCVPVVLNIAENSTRHARERV